MFFWCSDRWFGADGADDDWWWSSWLWCCSAINKISSLCFQRQIFNTWTDNDGDDGDNYGDNVGDTGATDCDNYGDDEDDDAALIILACDRSPVITYIIWTIAMMLLSLAVSHVVTRFLDIIKTRLSTTYMSRTLPKRL